MLRRLTAEGSSCVRMVSESCHHRPSIGPRRPSVSIALRNFWLISRTVAGVVSGSYRIEVRPSRSVGSLEPFAWTMNVRRMPSAPPNKPASNTTLSRGEASPAGDLSVIVQSSRANTNAATSTVCESSTSRSSVDRPGLNVVVQGSTSATSESPFAIAWSSLVWSPDDPRKIRGLFMRHSPRQSWCERYAVSHARAPGVHLRRSGAGTRLLLARDASPLTRASDGRDGFGRAGRSRAENEGGDPDDHVPDTPFLQD